MSGFVMLLVLAAVGLTAALLLCKSHEQRAATGVAFAVLIVFYLCCWLLRGPDSGGVPLLLVSACFLLPPAAYVAAFMAVNRKAQRTTGLGELRSKAPASRVTANHAAADRAMTDRKPVVRSKARPAASRNRPSVSEGGRGKAHPARPRVQMVAPAGSQPPGFVPVDAASMGAGSARGATWRNPDDADAPIAKAESEVEAEVEVEVTTSTAEALAPTDTNPAEAPSETAWEDAAAREDAAAALEDEAAALEDEAAALEAQSTVRLTPVAEAAAEPAAPIEEPDDPASVVEQAMTPRPRSRDEVALAPIVPPLSPGDPEPELRPSPGQALDILPAVQPDEPPEQESGEALGLLPEDPPDVPSAPETEALPEALSELPSEQEVPEPASSPETGCEPESASGSATACGSQGQPFDAERFFSKAAALRDRGLFLVAAPVYAECAARSDDPDVVRKASFEELACYVKGGRVGKAKELASGLRDSLGDATPVEAMKLDAVLGMEA